MLKSGIKQNVLLLFILSFFAIATTSCTYHKEEIEYPIDPNSCDTSAITFGGNIAPLLNSNCVSCHNNSLTNGGVNLSNYIGVKNAVDAGVLLPAVDWSGPIKMPDGGSKLSDCNISFIRIWINDGAVNN